MNLSFNPRVWIIPFFVLFLSSSFQLFDLIEALRFERIPIVNGEFWRLVTGNLTHLGWSHLLLNALGLVMTWVFFDKEFTPVEWLVLLFLCGLGVTGGLLMLNPELVWYVGLSGLLHGLFIAGAMQTLRGEPMFSGVLLSGFIAKLAYEQFQGAMPGTADMAGGPVVVDSHLYGAITGTLLGAVFLVIKRMKNA